MKTLRKSYNQKSFLNSIFAIVVKKSDAEHHSELKKSTPPLFSYYIVSASAS